MTTSLAQSDRQRFNVEVLLPLADDFFEARVVGDLGSAVSGNRPVIFVANHSGGSLSWDNIIFQALADRWDAQAAGRRIGLTRLIHQRLYQDHVSPFHIRDWWKTMGCTQVSVNEMIALLRAGRNVFISPEGVAGLSKPGWNASNLLRFSSSFVHAAKVTNAIVVPVAIHGSCHLNPFSIGFTKMNSVADRLLKWPFLPLSLLIPLVLFPRNFILPWPTRMVYELLEPIEFDGPDAIAVNRRQAQEVRESIAARLRANRRSFWRTTNWRALLRGDYAWGMYRQFWATYLGRPLRQWERALFNLPLVGYYLVRKYAENYQSETSNETCAA